MHSLNSIDYSKMRYFINSIFLSLRLFGKEACGGFLNNTDFLRKNDRIKERAALNNKSTFQNSNAGTSIDTLLGSHVMSPLIGGRVRVWVMVREGAFKCCWGKEGWQESRCLGIWRPLN